MLALDAHRHRLIVAAESGAAAVFVVADGRLQPLRRGLVGPNAHAVEADLASGLLYFSIADLHDRPALRILRPPLD
ncbi:MAG: hypothetical protein KGJ55_10970 [Gammaproteobacteria bacterium]|nr:hypothetical protein [Gammaproteobacteria bacterium]